MPGSQSAKGRFEMLLSVKEHEMHHRGQLMLIERQLGIVPHLTREREARLGRTAGIDRAVTEQVRGRVGEARRTNSGETSRAGCGARPVVPQGLQGSHVWYLG